MSLLRRFRRQFARRRQAAAERRKPAPTPRPRRVLMEPMEPRILLSADLAFSLGGGTQDLTLLYDGTDSDSSGGVDIQLWDGGSKLTQADLDGSGEINLSLTGNPGDDLVNLDFSGLENIATDGFAFDTLNLELGGGNGDNSI